MCNYIYAITERAVKRISLVRPAVAEGIRPNHHERRRASDRRVRHNRSYMAGEIALTVPGLGLRCHHDRSLRTNAARSTRSGTRNRDRPAATATNASSGTALVPPAGNEVRRPWPSGWTTGPPPPFGG